MMELGEMGADGGRARSRRKVGGLLDGGRMWPARVSGWLWLHLKKKSKTKKTERKIK